MGSDGVREGEATNILGSLFNNQPSLPSCPVIRPSSQDPVVVPVENERVSTRRGCKTCGTPTGAAREEAMRADRMIMAEKKRMISLAEETRGDLWGMWLRRLGPLYCRFLQEHIDAHHRLAFSHGWEIWLKNK